MGIQEIFCGRKVGASFLIEGLLCLGWKGGQRLRGRARVGVRGFEKRGCWWVERGVWVPVGRAALLRRETMSADPQIPR